MSTQDNTAPEGPPPATPEGVAEGSTPSIVADPAAGDGTAPNGGPEALPEPEPLPAVEPESEALPEPEPAPAEPRKIVHTAITDAAYDAALGTHPVYTPGRADLVLVIECPESYDEADITAEAVAADPSITVISRVRPEQPATEAEQPATPAPELEVAATDEQIAAIDLSSTAPDSGEPRKPMKIVRTNVTDAAHAEAVRAMGGRAEPGKHDHVVMVEMPEDTDEANLTADRIVQDPEISVVSRVRAKPFELIPAGTPGAEQLTSSTQVGAGDEASPLEAIFNELESARNTMREAAAKLKGQGHHEGIVAFQIEELARRLTDQMRYLEREAAKPQL